MEQDLEYRQQLVKQYKKSAEPLFKYIPWLERSAGNASSSNFRGQDIEENSISFPVYDSTLMNFVKLAAKTELMDRNYPYIYTRNHLRSHEDERKQIEKASIKEWGILCGILSKYVLEGRHKGQLWSQAVTERIFLLTLLKMREILEYWDRPIDIV
ncbi:hypothetical protein LJC58_02455 [Lachnospiraceae bacterium OttesenSCG-928-D06]|nr:hypothetical protein [Lachnospiraceae bacterium OttesenSCG-928-D06]